MGVGIRQSAGWIHVLALSLPTLGFWLLCASLTRIYHRVKQLTPAAIENRPSEKQPQKRRCRLLGMLDNVIHSQRIPRLGLVWAAVSLFAVYWQTWYWNHVLRVDRGISLRFTLFFCLAGIYFLIAWRILWSLFVIVRILARRHQIFRVCCYIAVFSLLLLQIPALRLTLQHASKKVPLEEFNQKDYSTAIVFGAGVYRNGTASSVLRDRVETAALLFQKGAVSQILMSGGNNAESRYETDVMAKLAIRLGVPETAILKDEIGLSTQATCENAVKTFGIRKGVLVTQAFHTTRALHTCEKAGMEALAVPADRSVYNIFAWISWQLRDWAGLTLLWFRDFLFR